MDEDLSALLAATAFQHSPTKAGSLELACKELVVHTQELLTIVAVHKQEALAKVNLKVDLMLVSLDPSVRSMRLADW
eukprot:CAMPEP_0204913942 /NCGR_PEP_ID=MMETSP1397-20131031/11812_1 /ASSEMBLY_ACC=CAM_ASM_000891 /TAXON_ID=49980 /ORGANISM="Climacostomum Climacostomum virens, Strain Stock W-24" /LENGTH=76 /DNA_ID=CAMNT_0052085313 /DNA_START=274 /DNA_END=501 /DNA_ORIENTATION=-